MPIIKSVIHDDITESEKADPFPYTYSVSWDKVTLLNDPYVSTDSCVIFSEDLKKVGCPDNMNVWLHQKDLCICGKPGTSHTGLSPFNAPNCTGFVLAGTIAEMLKQDVASKDILKLVKNSIPDDWKRHKVNGGWVYKNAQVSPNSFIESTAVIYDNAVVKDNVNVEGDAKIFGYAIVKAGSYIYKRAKVGGHAVVGECTAISGDAKIYGTIGKNCNISGKTWIKAGEVVTDNTFLIETPILYRTQKAIGVSILKKAGFDVPNNKTYRIERLKTKTQLEKLLGSFVRPCPVTPRHGFVDSRSINTLEEARQLVRETKLADSLAEFIVMPFINASHSGIWTEGQLCIGTGNDGATAGRNTIIIPIQGKPEYKKNWNDLLKEAKIKNSPYLELLWLTDEEDYYGGDSSTKINKYTTKFVQLRDGPKLPESVDFIPEKIKVKTVVLAEGDLLEWESKVKKFQPGTVVYHPGGSLASHYSVHAYLSGIPVLISQEPKIGDTLKPNTDAPTPNINEIRRGFQIGCNIKSSYKQAAYMMMLGCHSTTKWLGRCDFLLGVSMGCCYRLIIAASLGEFRRYDTHILDENKSLGSREDVYARVWDDTLTNDVKSQFEAAMKSFDEDAWGGSIGGPNWFILSRWAALLHNSLIDGNEKEALEYLNKGVNSVHNGGWTFNKFIAKVEMDNTAKNPVYALLKISPLVYNSTKLNIIPTFLSKCSVKDVPDIEKYLEDKKSIPYTPKNNVNKYNKKCCSDNCCGNPDCAECHPLMEQMYISCPYGAGDKSIEHAGKEAMLLDFNYNPQVYFPACENHLNYYISQPDSYKLLIKCPQCGSTNVQYSTFLDKGAYFHCGTWFGEKNTVVPDPPSDVICTDHDCPTCYPDGCNCCHLACHDCQLDTCINCNINEKIETETK